MAGVERYRRMTVEQAIKLSESLADELLAAAQELLEEVQRRDESNRDPT